MDYIKRNWKFFKKIKKINYYYLLVIEKEDENLKKSIELLKEKLKEKIEKIYNYRKEIPLLIDSVLQKKLEEENNEIISFISLYKEKNENFLKENKEINYEEFQELFNNLEEEFQDKIEKYIELRKIIPKTFQKAQKIIDIIQVFSFF